MLRRLIGMARMSGITPLWLGALVLALSVLATPVEANNSCKPDPACKPQFNLEIHMPNGDKVYKVLGPHAPNLTSNEVNLLHRLWLRFSESVGGKELHHHDVVHFALEEVQKELDEGRDEEVIARLRTHLEANQQKKTPLS